MPALNFKAEFADLVASGTKCQTIRAGRKHPIKPGDTLYLYTGMRTTACRLLRITPCTGTWPIRIIARGDVAWVWISDHPLPRESIELLANNDGFKNIAEFATFFRVMHSEDFLGDLIRWNPHQCASVPISG